mgnify:FL=1
MGENLHSVGFAEVEYEIGRFLKGAADSLL